jgi:hypothetical protein
VRHAKPSRRVPHRRRDVERLAILALPFQRLEQEDACGGERFLAARLGCRIDRLLEDGPEAIEVTSRHDALERLCCQRERLGGPQAVRACQAERRLDHVRAALVAVSPRERLGRAQEIRRSIVHGRRDRPGALVRLARVEERARVERCGAEHLFERLPALGRCVDTRSIRDSERLAAVEDDGVARVGRERPSARRARDSRARAAQSSARAKWCASVS